MFVNTFDKNSNKVIKYPFDRDEKRFLFTKYSLVSIKKIKLDSVKT